MDEQIRATLQILAPLIGKWEGRGTAEFPTIRTFDYKEELAWTSNDIQPFLHYEQRTWKKSAEMSDYAPSHWESGFLRVLTAKQVEVVNAQGGGRAEVLRGTLEATADGFFLDLQSVAVVNDARIGRTSRHFELQSNRLKYTMHMSLANVPEMNLHLTAILTKTS